MLLKNGQPFELSPEQKKQVLSKFDRFPVILNYHPNKRQWDDKNKVWKQPPVLAIETTGTARIDDELVSIKYASSIRTSQKGVIITSPGMVECDGNMRIEKSNVDFLWWLYYCADKISNNDKASKTPFFSFEKKADAAKKTIGQRSEIFEAEQFLLSEDKGLSIDHLIEVAISFNVPVENVSPEEIKESLMAVVSNDKLRSDFITRCKELSSGNSDILIENLIRDGLESKVIRHKPKSWSFFFVNEKNELGELFTTVKSAKDVNKSLADKLYEKKALVDILKKEIDLKKGN